MINAAQFCDLLVKHGFNFASGVPCSILTDILIHLSDNNDIAYIAASREDEALGIATGAYLAGKQPVVLMQNSGLGNSINALTSLDILYKIPILLVITWRGHEGNDAPEHLIMGKAMIDLLDDIGVPSQVLSTGNEAYIIGSMIQKMKQEQTPAAIIIPKGIVK